MYNQSHPILHLKCIIGFIFVLILYKCRNDSKESNKPDNIHSIPENCVKILHPVWVDEFTELDELYSNRKTYNAAILKGFIKNMCLDTVVIHLNSRGLHVGADEYYLTNDNGYGEIIDDLTKSKIKLGPADSVYLTISSCNSYEVDYIDSIQLVAHIDYSNGDYLGILKIYKEDFYGRSLLFSEYYRLMIDDYRKKIRSE